MENAYQKFQTLPSLRFTLYARAEHNHGNLRYARACDPPGGIDIGIWPEIQNAFTLNGSHQLIQIKQDQFKFQDQL